jgi:hypothetical protein
MSQIYAALGIADTDRAYINTLGQALVYEATQELLADYNADLAAAMAVFVERTTTDHKIRYKLPMGGRMQRRGGQARAGAVKAVGQWDVALPLEEFGDAVAGDRVSMAYMTIQEYDRQLDGIMLRSKNTRRHELLRTLFRNDSRSWEDENYGALTLVPLANGDAVVYPPIQGSESEATSDHFLVSGYAASAISDTNNPVRTMVRKLVQRFGAEQGNSNIGIFIHSDQLNLIADLADFEEVTDRFVVLGADGNTLSGLPQNVPGRVVGRVDGAWIIEWDWIPTGYLMGIHFGAPRPVLQRVDPAETGLSTGLQLVSSDEKYPFEGSQWSDRFGLGVGNRLNGVVMQLKASGSYDIPAAFAD